MFQKFNTDTLGGRYIKSLLAQTPVPLFNSVVDGDQLVERCYYVYRSYIIECVVGGVLYVDPNETLYPSSTLYPSTTLYPGIGHRAAKFYVRSIVDMPHRKTHATYLSNTNYYDSKTHYHLGRYLRYLLTNTGLNLFPFYNCYNDTYFSDVELYVDKSDSSSSYIAAKRVIKEHYKVIGVPILYGHTYTVYIDCPTQVMMKAIIHDDSGYVEDNQLPADAVTDIARSGKLLPHMSFNQPVSFRVETNKIDAMMLERNLYLAIQLPLSNNSSIVVLENYHNKDGIYCDKNSVRKYNVVNPSLIAMNNRITYAFSDRLIEYLVGQVIHKNDPISQNINYAQTLMANLSDEYKRTFFAGRRIKGVWDNDLMNQIHKFIDDHSNTHNLYDQDGFFNKDIQKLIYSGGEYTS